MTFKPNLSVKEGLDHLAKRLDPIIGERFSADLGDHPWTVVLEILDQKKGYSGSHKYGTHDLQAQLRMLTERLGEQGYPFDDHQRTASTIGSELRIVRNQMAHMHDFSIDEAFRANDFAVRLLEYFGDVDGLTEAARIRHDALTALAAKEGVTEQVAAETAAVPATPTTPEPSTPADEETEPVVPAPEVLVREPSAIGDKRLEFEPWTVIPVGDLDVLDALPKKAAKEKVRAVAVEIATYEGPIHLDRLTDRTAQSFGVQRLRSNREKKISYQIQQTGLVIDEDKFVWPDEIDPATWAEFRPNSSDADRPFAHISPVEIANAARFLKAKHPDIADDDLTTAVLQTFGRKRRTKQVIAHLARVGALP